MRRRAFGRFGTVSALTLGGGGIGQVWGPTDRREAVATVREAVDAGITFIDVAPSYGDGEAELVVGEAFAGVPPPGVRFSTKHLLGNPPAAEVRARLERSLEESLARMRLSRVDLYVLHGQIIPGEEVGRLRGTPYRLFVDHVRPAFEAMVAEGRIGGWGITAVGVPSEVLDVIAGDPPPWAIQAITNLLDSPGSMRRFDGPARPREIIAAAAARGIGVMGIRAVQAGALTDALDRQLPREHPEMVDYGRAEPFRQIAAELGEPPAELAHRYALSMEGVSTVVIGVKNRVELRSCLRAEERGPLDPDLIARIDEAVRG